MITPESCVVAETCNSFGNDSRLAAREWYRVDDRSGGKSWKDPRESCWTNDVLPCLISPAYEIYYQLGPQNRHCTPGETRHTSPPKTSTRHSNPIQIPNIGNLPIPQVRTSLLIPLSVEGCPGPGLITTRSRSPASNIA